MIYHYYQRFVTSMTIAMMMLSLVSSQTTSTAFTVSSVWMAGSNSTMNSLLAVYGSPGIASSTADPGGRNNACSAASQSGLDTFYMFGGYAGSGASMIVLQKYTNF